MTHITPEAIMKLGSGFMAAKTLLSAVEIGLFSRLAKGPADLETLRCDLELHERSARDFLDALVALRMLDRDGLTYKNTPEADLVLDRAKPSYVGGLLEMASTRLYAFWGGLTEALRTGEPQNEAKGAPDGVDLFAPLYADRARLRTFLRAMSGLSAGAAHAIAAKLPWKDYKSFADVGTAEGMLPVTVARAHSHLVGIGFDLPEVGPLFDEFVAEQGLAPRLRFQAGNFFEGELPTADVIVMGHILHDWDLAKKKVPLKKAYDALPKGGALVTYEAVIDDDRRENTFALLMSLNMLIETKGGFDYTGADCQGWMREVGFTSTRVEPLVGPDSMVIGIK